MKVIKSTPNEINAVIVLKIGKENFELEYTYDNESIVYDELIEMNEVQSKIDELRSIGYSAKFS